MTRQQHQCVENARPVLLVEGTGRGFINQYTHALALGLSQQGTDVRLLTGRNDELNDWCAPFGKYATMPRGARAWYRVARTLQALRPGIVHFQWIDNPLMGLPLVQHWRRCGVRVVYTPHNILPHCSRWICMPAYRAWYRSMDGIVVRDRHMAWALEEVLQIPRERLLIVADSPNLVSELPRVKPSEAGLPVRRDGEIRLLVFGHGGQGKGLDCLLRALAGHAWPTRLHLLLAGKGMLEGIEPGLLNAARTRLRVTIINRYIDPWHVSTVFRDADLLVLPYLKICKSPLVDLAGDFGMPVLRSDRVDAARFEDGTHGLTVPHGDETRLGRAVQSLIEPPAKLVTMAARLADASDSQRRMSAFAQSHLRLYQAALATESAATWLGSRHQLGPQRPAAADTRG